MFMLRHHAAGHWHIITLAHYYRLKQLEGEFAAYFLILPVGKAGKQTKVKDMRTNAIPHFQIRFQVRYYQCIQIQTFVQYILGIFHQMAEQKERCFVCKVSTDIFAGKSYTNVRQATGTPPPISSLQPIGRLERRKLAKSTKYSSF